MARKSKNITKRQTVKEFKAWLAGILEFQPNNWCPDPGQWKTIQERINNLKEEFEVYEKMDTPKTIPTVLTRPNNPQTSKDIIPPGNAIQLLPLGDDIPAEVIATPASLDSSLQPTVHTVSSRVIANTGTKMKTPSDISGNPYKTPFA